MAQDKISVRQFLRTLAPDFCWMTSFDLFIMYEQINEEATEDVFKTTLCQLKDLFDRKVVPRTNPAQRGIYNVYAYKRRTLHEHS